MVPARSLWPMTLRRAMVALHPDARPASLASNASGASPAAARVRFMAAAMSVGDGATAVDWAWMGAAVAGVRTGAVVTTVRVRWLRDTVGATWRSPAAEVVGVDAAGAV